MVENLEQLLFFDGAEAGSYERAVHREELADLDHAPFGQPLVYHVFCLEDHLPLGELLRDLGGNLFVRL